MWRFRRCVKQFLYVCHPEGARRATEGSIVRFFGCLRQPQNDIRERGFTFIELLLALVIMGICFVPLMQMFSVSLSEIGYIDDMRTALDLAREEVEKVKNIGLTEDQIKNMGNVSSPPIVLNARQWRAVRVVRREVSPLEFTVYIFKGDSLQQPVIAVSTIVQK